MKEILGGGLDKAFEELNLYAQKMYELKNKSWEYCEIYQVWRLPDEDYDKLCLIPENAWKDNWGWWRSAEGCVLGNPDHRYNIKHHYIWAWDNDNRIEKDYYKDRKYRNLLEYFSEELNLSAERNVCALSVDLAKYNGMTMAELYNKYQG
jgi:hypothetical protein